MRIDFRSLASSPAATLDQLALALAAEFRDVDADSALAELDDLGRSLTLEHVVGPGEELEACRRLLADREGFVGATDDYDHPDNSMLDLVLARRAGLPILVSLVYVEVARRAGVPLHGVGLPGHFVVGHFGADPPILIDPFAGGRRIRSEALDDGEIRPWSPQETALRMLNNLVGAYARRGDLVHALRAAELRLALPLDEPLRESLDLELRKLHSRLN